MRKLILIISFIFITSPLFAGFLGEFEQGENIYIWTQINNADGSAATNATTGHCSLWDHNDASSPTASGSLVLLSGAIDGFYKYTYNGCIDGLLATGPCVVRLKAKVTGQRPAAIHTFFVVDSGHGPNFRSILTTSDNIGINWADISNKTTAVDLSATDIQLVDTATDVTNGVTASSVTDKTGYSLISGQLSPILTSMEIDHSMRDTRDASDQTVAANIVTINTNTDGDGSGGIDADINTIMGYTDTLEASMSTVNRKQNEIKASLETVIVYVDILPSTTPASWNDTQDSDSVYAWITTDSNIVQDNELTNLGLADSSANRAVIIGALRGMNAASVASVEGSLIDKIDDMAASLKTVAAGTTLANNITNKTIIATALKDINIASAEAVYGSVIWKINGIASTGQLVWATIPNVRSQLFNIIDEIRKNR